MDKERERELVSTWRDDPQGAYRGWFLFEQRLKNFRSIRRGLQVVVEEIGRGGFGNSYRGSSLETVVGSIAEQRPIFKGADHAFLWKPKLRIPDIYENPENQRAFGRFLDACLCCGDGQSVLSEIHRLDAVKIKGLGPAVANLLYFLHPTEVTPFNTAIVKGYNAVTGSRAKLGRWDEYIAMREGVLKFNERHRDLLSNDLGAAAAFFFDAGSGRFGDVGSAASPAAWQAELERVRREAREAAPVRSEQDQRTHTELQAWLRDLGRALGFEVWMASNDRAREFAGGRLGDGCLSELPAAIAVCPELDTIRLIDVLWLKQGAVVAAFEVEHTTSIYSGILRLFDLAAGSAGAAVQGLYLVAPDDREDEARAQLSRPSFRDAARLGVRFLPYSELEKHRESMARFGDGLKAVQSVARTLV